MVVVSFSPTIKPDQARSGAWSSLSHPSLDGGAVSLRLAGTGAPLELESSAVMHVANMRRHEPYLTSGPVVVVLRLSGRGARQGVLEGHGSCIVPSSVLGACWLFACRGFIVYRHVRSVAV